MEKIYFLSIYFCENQWLMDHPEFQSNPVYVGGDSYSGMTVPMVTQLISMGKKIKDVSRISIHKRV